MSEDTPHRNTSAVVHAPMPVQEPGATPSHARTATCGRNFLCASAKMEGLLPADIHQTRVDKVITDLPKETLGLRFAPRLAP